MAKSIRGFVGDTGASMARLQRGFRVVGSTANNLYDSLSFGKGAAITAVGVGLLTAGITSFVNEASKIENATANFTPLLGSVEKADKLITMMTETAATTPFEFEDITKSVQQLLPIMNGDLQKTISTFRMLGDTAGGNTQKLDSITRGFAKAALKGKVDLESLNMIGEAGVPIIRELAKSMGLMSGVDASGNKMVSEKDTAKLLKMISAGKVPVSELDKAFQQMTSKGGIFFNGMAIASETFTGQLSTLTDNIKMTFAAIGMQMLPILKEYMAELSKVVERVLAWAKANQELIASKFRSFLENVWSVTKFLIDNFDTLVTLVKWYAIALVTVRVVSLACSVATGIMTAAIFAYNVALGISTALTGKSAFFVHGNTVAYAAFRATVIATSVAMWLWNGAVTAYNFVAGIATKAQMALNAAMLANPIGLIIIAIVILITLVVVAIKYWDEWGAVLAVFMGPLGMILSIIMSIKRNWDMIRDSFTNGGILEGIKAIGITLLDAIIMPLQQMVELVAKVTGAEWAENFAKDIARFRQEIGAINVNDPMKNIRNETQPAPVAPLVSKDNAQNDFVREMLMQQKQMQELNVNIKDPGNNAIVDPSNGFAKINLTSTR